MTIRKRHNPTLGAVLKDGRTATGLTQDDAATVFGVHVTLLGRYESGDVTPNPVILNRMSNLYGLDEDMLFALAYTPERLKPAKPEPRRVRPSAWPERLLGEWLIVTGAVGYFGPDRCADMLDGRDGCSCDAVEDMGHVRLVCRTPRLTRTYTIPDKWRRRR